MKKTWNQRRELSRRLPNAERSGSPAQSLGSSRASAPATGTYPSYAARQSGRNLDQAALTRRPESPNFRHPAADRRGRMPPVRAPRRRSGPLMHRTPTISRHRCSQRAGRRGRAAAALPLAVALALGLTLGCTPAKHASLRPAPRTPLTLELKFDKRGGVELSPRTRQVLRRLDLAEKLPADPQPLLAQLQAQLEREPTPEKIYAYAEVSYASGQQLERTNPRAALDLYGGAVAHAYWYLFDPVTAAARNPFDPQYRGACDLYNTGLEHCLRMMKHEGLLVPGHTCAIQTAERTWQCAIAMQNPAWRAGEFERFEFCSDYEVAGLTNQYHGYGLGVPLVAVRRRENEADPNAQFYPPGLAVPMTAFVRLVDDPRRLQVGTPLRAVLELHDPLVVDTVSVGSYRVPLESDLTTPLAYFLDTPNLDKLGLLGFVRPSQAADVRGLYLVQPYQPGKIPVVLVHGLLSSPLTWMEMFNDLRSDPAIRANYQFWFYLYPTGQPFWRTAAELRSDLAHARQVLDPRHAEPAFDRMVLVGHSMGGLVSRMQVVSSGDAYWQLVSNQPIEAIQASYEDRDTLARDFFFQANPSVSRVITLGTPFGGSRLANDFTRYLGRKVVRLPQRMMRGMQPLFRDNPGAFKDPELLTEATSIDSLSPDSPVLAQLRNSPVTPGLRHHNIVGLVDKAGFKDYLQGRFTSRGDGVVPLASAQLEHADSELVVPADHVHVHRHPRSVLEVRRVLLQHLVESRALANPVQHAHRDPAFPGAAPTPGFSAPHPPQPRTAQQPPPVPPTPPVARR